MSAHATAPALSPEHLAVFDLEGTLFRHGRSSVEVVEGMVPLIRALATRGWHIGLATMASRRRVDILLRAFGLEDSFDVVKTADDGPSKPAPHILFEAMAELGISPDNTVMIGDSPCDMEFARNAGVSAIGVTWSGTSIEMLERAGAKVVVGTAAALGEALEVR